MGGAACIMKHYCVYCKRVCVRVNYVLYACVQVLVGGSLMVGIDYQQQHGDWWNENEEEGGREGGKETRESGGGNTSWRDRSFWIKGPAPSSARVSLVME